MVQALRYQQRLRTVGGDTDYRSESSSVTEEEVGSAEDAANQTETEPVAAKLLGAPTDQDEQEAVQPLDEWDFEASPTSSRPIVSDAEILLSVGAGHLVQEEPDQCMSAKDPHN